MIFQTRLSSSGEVPESEVEPLNEGRVAMVRALREAFGVDSSAVSCPHRWRSNDIQTT